MMPREFRVFYSWQSDSNRTTNHEFIMKALEAAATALSHSESRPDFRVYIDEATRDETGSPNIPETILKKIASCDAFVCDVTTINPGADGRKVPNPNAVYELGYAVAMFGWPRISLVFNAAIGAFPDDLPFDFDRHRAHKYKAIPATSKPTKDALESAKKELVHFFIDALGAIIDGNPKSPDWRTAVSDAERKRQRDIGTLRLLLRDLPIDEIDRFTNDLPIKIVKSNLHFWEGYHANWTAITTYVYDEVLKAILMEIHDSWEETLAYPEHFSNEHHVYYIWNGDPFNDATKQAQDSIFQAAQKMKNATVRLVSLINESYLEIDVLETSRAAWNDYIQFMKEPLGRANDLEENGEEGEGE